MESRRSVLTCALRVAALRHPEADLCKHTQPGAVNLPAPSLLPDGRCCLWNTCSPGWRGSHWACRSSSRGFRSSRCRCSRSSRRPAAASAHYERRSRADFTSAHYERTSRTHITSAHHARTHVRTRRAQTNTERTGHPQHTHSQRSAHLVRAYFGLVLGVEVVVQPHVVDGDADRPDACGHIRTTATISRITKCIGCRSLLLLLLLLLTTCS